MNRVLFSHVFLMMLFLSRASFAQPPFISTAHGDWNQGSTWGRAGNVAGTDFPILGQAATIAQGTTVIVPAGTFGVGSLTVENVATAVLKVNGTLEIDGALTGGTTHGALDVEGGGRLVLKDGATVQAGWSRMFIKRNGTLEINYSTGGIVPACTYEQGSILTFTGYTSPTATAPAFESGIVLHDVEWACVNQGNNIFLNGGMPGLKGYFRVSSTGSQPMRLVLASNGAYDATVTGNFEVSGGSYLVLTDGTASATLAINGNISVMGGATFEAGAGNISMAGADWNISGGVFLPGTGTVTFSGATAVTGTSTLLFNNVVINAGNSLTAPTGSINVGGTFTNHGTFTHNGGTVIFNGTSTIEGSVIPTFNHVAVTGAFNAPALLNLNGDLILNNGVFNHNSGTVTFNGAQNQVMNRTSGAGVVTYDLFNIIVNKSSGTFFIESDISGTTFTVENEFTISQNGAATEDVDLDGGSGAGTLVLRSSSTRTARIPAIPSGVVVIGNLAVERFIPNTNATRAYRYLAPPVIGSNVADWQDEVPITGLFSDPSTGAGIPNPQNPSMYRYIEATGGTASNRYQAYPNDVTLPASSFSLDNGTGYAVYVRSVGTPTLVTKGALRTGDVPLSVTLTGTEADAAGFNLVGNPYPAPIDWDLITLPAAISSTISIKDNVNNAGAGVGNFVYYIQGGPDVGGFTGIVASGQAFWVETSANATLTFSESHKASDINPVLVRQKYVANVLRIKISGNGKEDEGVIWLKDGATDGVDLRYDAKKKTNDHLNLYSYLESSPDIKYAINGVATFGCSKTFRLGITDLNSSGINAVPAGSYRFNFSEFETFNDRYNFSLVDNVTRTIVVIRDNAEYSFDITADPATFGDSRFEIIVARPEIQMDRVIDYHDVCENAGASIIIKNTQLSIFYEVRNQQGDIISDVVTGNGNSAALNIDGNKLVNGMNNLMVYATNGVCEPVQLARLISLKVHEIYRVQPLENAQSCLRGAVSLKASGVPSDGQYYWYETETATEPIGIGAEWTTPPLQKSKTYYVAARNALDCEGPRVAVKAEIVQFDAAVISASEGVLRSNYREGNQWYLDDTLIPEATGQHIIPDRSGLYKVVITVSGCLTSSEFEFFLTASENGRGVESFAIYPNPTEGKVRIQLKSLETAGGRIINSLGKTVGFLSFVVKGDTKNAEYDLQGEPAGLFLVEILQGKELINYRIIKK